jgi:hypothetical protein
VNSGLAEGGLWNGQQVLQTSFFAGGLLELHCVWWLSTKHCCTLEQYLCCMHSTYHSDHVACVLKITALYSHVYGTRWTPTSECTKLCGVLYAYVVLWTCNILPQLVTMQCFCISTLTCNGFVNYSCFTYLIFNNAPSSCPRNMFCPYCQVTLATPSLFTANM